jgi:large subunit ribosomal protein L29
MKFSDIKVMSTSQISVECLNVKKELFNLRFQKSAGEKIKSSRLRELKKRYARLLTVVNELNRNMGVV